MIYPAIPANWRTMPKKQLRAFLDKAEAEVLQLKRQISRRLFGIVK